MKRIIIICFLAGFFFPFLFAQNGEHVEGGCFLKRVEYNLRIFKDGYNLDSKGDVEKLFFGDFNAPVEFFYEPSFEGASGFRVARDSLKTSYTFELKYVSNYEEAQKEASDKYKSIAIPYDWVISGDIPDEIKEHNRAMRSKYREELPKLFKVETRSFSISNQFAEKLHEKMILFIDNIKAKGVQRGVFDCYSVVFRNVVEDEVWSLYIHMPQGDALKMADLCSQIITDAKENQLDEAKYMSVLETFEYK